MANKQMQPLVDMTRAELTERLAELQEELFNLKFRNKMRQLDNPLQIRTLRRQIARARTLLAVQERQEKQA